MLDNRRVAVAAALVLLIIVMGTPGVAGAQTVIDTDTTWTVAQSPIRLAEDATVLEGVTLTIDPGVTVELGASVSVWIAGELIARGTEVAPVVFTGDASGGEPARWGSLVFLDSSVDATYEEVDDYVAGSILEYCVLEHATRAVQLLGASPYIHRSLFRHNHYEADDDTMGGAGILVVEGGAPRIVACEFHDNVATGAEGGAIRADHSAPIIQDNLFTANTSVYGGAIAVYNVLSPIVGNDFEGNDGGFEGGAISLYSSSSAFLNNRVVGNFSVFDGGGVHVCVDCFPHANPLLLDNTITDNEAAFEGGGGVGAAYLRVLAFNNIHDNVMNGDPADLAWFNVLAEGYPEWVQNPDCGRNWWGTDDPDAIAETIHDGTDEEGYGVALYEPFLSAPVEAPETRVTITSLKIRYAADDDPMPVLLTLYNPGPEREVKLLLMLGPEETPPAFYTGPLGYPGEVATDDGHELLLPEGSVFYTTIMAPGYVPMAGVADVFWRAVLVDAQTGARIGVVSRAGVRIGSAGGGA